MTAPLIGLTSARTTSDLGFPLFSVQEAYAKAVLAAGGTPLLIPLGLPEDTIAALLPRLDGVLFTGGGDIAPQRYGSQPHPLVDGVDEDRDQMEIALLRETVMRGMPFLGICRGLQVINVALGGTLWEDLHTQRPATDLHQYSGLQPRTYHAHTVDVDPSSRLAQVLACERPEVNSLHHQGIRELAPDLRAVAFSPDGVVEGAELPGYPFGLSVQWHPEWLPGQPEMRRLFQAFVQAAAGASL